MKGKFRKLFYVFAALLLAVVLAGCKGKKPTSMSLTLSEVTCQQESKNFLILDRGGSALYELEFEPKDAKKDVTWVVKDPSIASVENGKLFGLKSGMTTLVVVSKLDTKLKAEVPVYVVEDFKFEERINFVVEHVKSEITKLGVIKNSKTEFPSSIYGDIKVSYATAPGKLSSFKEENGKPFFLNLENAEVPAFEVSIRVSTAFPGGKLSTFNVNIPLGKVDAEISETEVSLLAGEIINKYANSLLGKTVENSFVLERSLRKMQYHLNGEFVLPELIEKYLLLTESKDIFVMKWNLDDGVDGRGIKVVYPKDEQKEVDAQLKDNQTYLDLEQKVVKLKQDLEDLKVKLEAETDPEKKLELQEKIDALIALIAETEEKARAAKAKFLPIKDLEYKFYSRPAKVEYEKPNDYTFGSVSGIFRVGGIYGKGESEVVVRGYTKEEIIAEVGAEISSDIPENKVIDGKNLTLKTFNRRFAMVIKWESSDQDILTNSGRMSLKEENNHKKVNLVAKISYSGTFYERFKFDHQFEFNELEIVQPEFGLKHAALLIQNTVDDLTNYDRLGREIERYQKTIIAPLEWKKIDAEIKGTTDPENEKVLKNALATIEVLKAQREEAKPAADKLKETGFTTYFPYGVEASINGPLKITELDSFTKFNLIPGFDKYDALTITWRCEQTAKRNDVENDTPTPVFSSDWHITKQFARYHETPLIGTLSLNGETHEVIININTGLTRDPVNLYQGGSLIKKKTVDGGQKLDNIHMASPYDEMVGEMGTYTDWRRYGLTGIQYTISYLEDGLINTLAVHQPGHRLTYFGLKNLTDEQKLHLRGKADGVYSYREFLLEENLALSNEEFMAVLLGNVKNMSTFTGLVDVAKDKLQAGFEDFKKQILEKWKAKFSTFSEEEKTKFKKQMAEPETEFVFEELVNAGVLETTPELGRVYTVNGTERLLALYLKESTGSKMDFDAKKLVTNVPIKISMGFDLQKNKLGVELSKNDDNHKALLNYIKANDSVTLSVVTEEEVINGKTITVNVVKYISPIDLEVKHYLNEDKFILNHLRLSEENGALENINGADPRFNVATGNVTTGGYDMQFVSNDSNYELMWGITYVKTWSGHKNLPDISGRMGVREYGNIKMTAWPGGYLVDATGRVFFASNEGENKMEEIIKKDLQSTQTKDENGNVTDWLLPNYIVVPKGGFGFSPFTNCRGMGTLDFVYNQFGEGHVQNYVYREDTEEAGKLVLAPKFDFAKGYDGAYGDEGKTFALDFYKQKLENLNKLPETTDEEKQAKEKAKLDLEYYLEYHRTRDLTVRFEVERYKVQINEVLNTGDKFTPNKQTTTIKAKDDEGNNTKFKLQFFAKPHGSMFTPAISNEVVVEITESVDGSYTYENGILEILKNTVLTIKAHSKTDPHVKFTHTVKNSEGKLVEVEEIMIEAVGKLAEEVTLEGTYGPSNEPIPEIGTGGAIDEKLNGEYHLDMKPKILPVEADQLFEYTLLRDDVVVTGGNDIEVTDTHELIIRRPGKYKIIVASAKNPDAKKFTFVVVMDKPDLIEMQIEPVTNFAVGDEVTLVVKAVPQYATPVLNGTFEASTNGIFVSNIGKVRGVEAGNRTVLYKYMIGSVAKQAQITINVLPENVTEILPGIGMRVEDVLDLNTVAGLQFYPIGSNPPLKWESSDVEKLTVVENTGVATAIMEGDVQVTVSVVGKPEISKTLNVKIYPKKVDVTSITIEGPNSLVFSPESLTNQYTATVLPNEASKELIWRSTDSAIFEVDNSGLVQIKQEGEATLWAFSVTNPEKFAFKKITITSKKYTVEELEALATEIESSYESPTFKFVIPTCPGVEITQDAEMKKYFNEEFKQVKLPKEEKQITLTLSYADPAWHKEIKKQIGFELLMHDKTDLVYYMDYSKSKNLTPPVSLNTQKESMGFCGYVVEVAKHDGTFVYFPLFAGQVITLTETDLNGDVVKDDSLHPYGGAFNPEESNGIVLDGGKPVTKGYYGAGALYVNNTGKDVKIDLKQTYGRNNLGKDYGHGTVILHYDADNKIYTFLLAEVIDKTIKNLPDSERIITLKAGDILYRSHNVDIKRGFCTTATASTHANPQDSDMFANEGNKLKLISLFGLELAD